VGYFVLFLSKLPQILRLCGVNGVVLLGWLSASASGSHHFFFSVDWLSCCGWSQCDNLVGVMATLRQPLLPLR
jgi:hypothetical protein